MRAARCRKTRSGGWSELRIEIYEPWYYRRSGPPQILAADRWLTGEQLVIRTTQAKEISVAIVRCGSCTHAFNSDQRYVSLKFDYKGGDELLVCQVQSILAQHWTADVIVTAAPNGNITPPGVDSLYTINRAGLPSDGITVFMSSDPQTQAEQERDNLYEGRSYCARPSRRPPFASDQTECEHIVAAMTALTPGLCRTRSTRTDDG